MRARLQSRPRLSPWATLLAGIVAGFATSSLAAPLCTPDLAITSAHLSEMRAARRIWTARIAVDASPCAATSGL